MNPYGLSHISSPPRDVTAPGSVPGPRPQQPPNPYDNSYNPSLSATLPSPPPVILTGHTYVTVLSQNSPPYQASSGQDGGQRLFPLPDCSISPLPASDPGFISRSRLQSSLAPVSSPPKTPYAASAPTPSPYPTPVPPTSCQVSIIIQSPAPLSPTRSQCSDDTCPDLECSVCYNRFNNIFRCPKMLQCRHTFCLECLARINVKSAQPNSIQCPLCRSLTPLPSLGLPRLSTDSDVLSYLPAAMQRIYSIRFNRKKGKLQVKRPSDGHQQWGRRSLTSLRSVNRSLDVGLPSPPVHGRRESGGLGGALFRLTGRPVCRAFLLTSVIMMLALLMGIVVFLVTFRIDANSE